MTSSAPEIQQTGRGVMAPLSLLEVESGFNVREDTSPDDEFLNSIKAHGVLRPLHVRNNPKRPGYYFIVDGERRFRAAAVAELEEVPIIPEGDMEDAAALVMSLVANEGSKPLTAKEEAVAFKRLKDGGVELAEIARVMGRSKRKVEETLRALESGDEELAKGVTTDEPAEKIPPRAAARAATLPAKERKSIVPKLKGKNAREGVKMVRDAEKASGIKRRGRKASDYPWAKDAKQRAELLEKAAKQLIKTDGVNRKAEAHLEVIACLKGKTEPGELYVEIMKEQQAEKAKKATAKKAPVKKAAAKKAPVKKKVVAKKKILRRAKKAAAA